MRLYQIPRGLRGLAAQPVTDAHLVPQAQVDMRTRLVVTMTLTARGCLMDSQGLQQNVWLMTQRYTLGCCKFIMIVLTQQDPFLMLKHKTRGAWA